MINYYVFVRQKGCLDPNDVIYHVKVGTSDREFAKLCLVKEFCKDCGHYFRKRGNETDIAMDFLHRSVFKGIPSYKLDFRKATLTISQLYQMIIDDTFDAFESNLASTLSQQYFYFKDNPKWRINHKSYVLQRELAISTRKYLSHSKESQSIQVAIATCLILILFMIESYLTGIGL